MRILFKKLVCYYLWVFLEKYITSNCLLWGNLQSRKISIFEICSRTCVTLYGQFHPFLMFIFIVLCNTLYGSPTSVGYRGWTGNKGMSSYCLIMLDLKSVLEEGYKAARTALIGMLEPETVIFKPSTQLGIGIGKHRAQKWAETFSSDKFWYNRCVVIF